VREGVAPAFFLYNYRLMEIRSLSQVHVGPRLL